MEMRQEKSIGSEAPVVRGVKSGIAAWYDRYLRVALVSDDVIKYFDGISTQVKSRLGQSVVARLSPHIAGFARISEAGTAVTDVVVGVIGAGFGFREGTGAIRDTRQTSAKLEKGVGGREAKILSPFSSKSENRMMGGLVGGGIAGIFLGLRPATRIVDAYYRHTLPLAERVVSAVDAIFLRREQKQPVRQVFVGQGKA